MCNITCKNVSTHSEKLSVIFMLYGRTSLLSSLVLRKECFAAFLCCLFCFVALVLSVGHKVCIFFCICTVSLLGKERNWVQSCLMVLVCIYNNVFFLLSF